MSQLFNFFEFEPADLSLFFATQQIHRDYQEFLKHAVVPPIAAKHDIRIRELLSLVCIASAIRPVSSADVADIMRQDPATITRSTVVLIGKTMITSSKSFEDSRIKVLHLTEFGQQVIGEYKALVTRGLDIIANSPEYSFLMEDSLQDHPTDIAAILDRAKLLARAANSLDFTVEN